MKDEITSVANTVFDGKDSENNNNTTNSGTSTNTQDRILVRENDRRAEKFMLWVSKEIEKHNKQKKEKMNKKGLVKNSKFFQAAIKSVVQQHNQIDTM